ncbi:MAG: hypothetical protein WAM14_13915 [Candidatus Nitrosopolaris sp.]
MKNDVCANHNYPTEENLVNAVRRYLRKDPDRIIKWAVHCSINGNNKFLDEKLAQLRSIDKCN